MGVVYIVEAGSGRAQHNKAEAIFGVWGDVKFDGPSSGNLIADRPDVVAGSAPSRPRR
jgi:hypothetical protein